jgi:catechol 2,3-dioxygenase-like lactoylglutathione lyase family enzyme
VLDNINPSLGLGIAGTRRLLIDTDQGFADGRRHLPAVTADIDDAVPPEEIPDLPALGPDPVLHERHLAVRSVGESRQHRRNAGPLPLLELLPAEVVDLGMVGAEEKQSGPDLLAALLLGGPVLQEAAEGATSGPAQIMMIDNGEEKPRNLASAMASQFQFMQETALHVWDLVRDGRLLGGVALRAARAARPHDRYSAGLHHIAFHAADRADVDRAHGLMEEQGAVILDAPADYPQYGIGYCAVLVADPDGLKLEVVHFTG